MDVIGDGDEQTLQAILGKSFSFSLFSSLFPLFFLCFCICIFAKESRDQRAVKRVEFSIRLGDGRAFNRSRHDSLAAMRGISRFRACRVTVLESF